MENEIKLFYSNSKIQYNTTLFNILNREIHNKPKYGFYLMITLMKNAFDYPYEKFPN